MYYVGVDVGGTNLKIGLIKDNALIDKIVQPTNYFDVIGQVVNFIDEILQRNSIDRALVDGVGVGFPGIVHDGKVAHSVNLNFIDCNLQDILQNQLDMKVLVYNDADLATMAEHRIGAGANCENMIYISIGTGVGGGIICNGNLYQGTMGAGELGHIPLFYGGIECNCGQKGCIEQYVSCTALSRQAIDKIKDYPESIIKVKDNYVHASDIMDAFDRQDKCAMEIVDRYVDYLSALVMAYCNIFRPNKIIIGGGIAHAPKIIEMTAKRVAKNKFGYPHSNSVEILVAKLGADAGVLGASVIF